MTVMECVCLISEDTLIRIEEGKSKITGTKESILRMFSSVYFNDNVNKIYISSMERGVLVINLDPPEKQQPKMLNIRGDYDEYE